ncbi:MAG: nucleotide exchange factor GrpE [Candidatus Komeilibacteria bacterium CG_4_10_14_0_2_um_filter_37_10]|uniref:Protein GrpE n=1 Tax=Candidatus Komeilibacteria bacterium CG_4_10_14_0_2_um_filter_37_10 TaxID=1974470 RepID=A0A2M7VGW0_9BACT|nr:MAG: nucleotide exchange factor GrpE [Candidatus Komeilibacteria bacterium CG_4_10_14_0_2_um_filter_37_10]
MSEENQQLDDEVIFPDDLALESEQKANEYKNNWLRAQADYQNLQKATAIWKEEYLFTANEQLIIELLPIYTHFATALSHVPKADEKLDWVVGLKHLYDMLDKFMKKCGVTKIETSGLIFDHKVHEAIGQQSDIGQIDHTVLQEVQPGYKLYERVMVPAKVIVNKLE